MQLFAFGANVKLTGPTGDDQIDAHLGATLQVIEFRRIPVLESHSPIRYSYIPNYTLVNLTTHETTTANEYELESAE